MATTIYTVVGLQAMKDDLTADYILGADIYAVGVAFDPIGGWNGQGAFTGSFDGKGYTIHDLEIDKNADDYVGLFGLTDDGIVIQNVTLNNPTIHGEDYTGALIGLILDDETVINCHIIGGSVTGNQYVGGLIGYALHDDGEVTISDCTASCTVTSDIGAAGNFNDVGGFIGYTHGVDCDECYASGAVTGIGECVGGFVGLDASDSTFDKCFASGAIETGNNGGESYCGGFAGYITGEHTNCYATGEVTATGDYVGGYSGLMSDTLDNCYSTGAVIGVGTNVGGLNGWLNGNTVTNCFWDTTTSGQASSFGGTGKTTAEMTDITTFQNAGWAISRIWNVLASCNSGYPCLIDVTPACAIQSSSSDQTIAGEKVTLEAIRNIEVTYGGRCYVAKGGNFVYESRYHRNV